MISKPVSDSYRIHVAKDFIYPEVLDKLKGYTNNRLPYYEKLVDYLNATITQAKIPGIVVPMTDKQMKSTGQTNKVYKNFTPYKENIDKQMTLTFSTKSGYLNWAIMYIQTQQFLSAGSPTFLPPVFLEVMDIDGVVLFRMEFKEVSIKRISDIEFNTSGSIVKDKFDVQLTFNEYDMIFEFDKILNDFNPDFYYG